MIFYIEKIGGRMLRDRGGKILLTEEHRAKICLDFICEFLHLWPDNSVDKNNMSVKDYSLQQFQSWVGKKIPYNPRNKKDEQRRRLLDMEYEDGQDSV